MARAGFTASGKRIASTTHYSVAPSGRATPTRTVTYSPSGSKTTTYPTSSKSMASKQNIINVAQGALQSPISNFKSGSSSVGSKTKKDSTAWSMIADKYNKSNWFNALYQKIDYAAYGFLPGGLSRDIVKAANVELKTEDTMALARAKARQEAADTIEDYSKKSWFEDLGFNYPAPEQAFQEQMLPGVIDNLIPDFGGIQLPSILSGGGSSSAPYSPISEGIGSGMKYGIPILIAGVIAVLALKKGK